MRILKIFTLLLFVISSCAHAKVILPSIISDNMVLQQQTKVKLWGTSGKKTDIEVSTSWNDRVYKTKSDSEGKWELVVETGKAGGPYKIVINDGDVVELNDILLGEVWLCSGQSNMEMPMKGFWGQPIEHSSEVIANATKKTPIRLFTVKRNPSKTLLDDCTGEWTYNVPENVANFSATAYFFGLQLQRSLNVPIGLVNSSWGGSAIQSWMDSEILKQYPEISQNHLTDNSDVKNPHSVASMLYNGMINPIKNYAFKGVIWYQGESNRYDAAQYESLFQSFVKDWRIKLNNDSLPFYYVQIAPYNYGNKDAVVSALLREAQYNCEKKIDNVGMVVTMDLGNETCIHPSKKKEVGSRLAYMALSKTYNIKGIYAESPRYKSHEVKGNKIIISFERAPLGVTSNYKPLHSFEIAGEDGVFYPAEARIVNRKFVEVWNDDVKKPVSVRYAYKNYVEGSLFGVNGMPVSSFVTEKNNN